TRIARARIARARTRIARARIARARTRIARARTRIARARTRIARAVRGCRGRRHARDVVRHAVRFLQLRELVARQMAPLPRAQALGRDPREGDAREAHHRKPGSLSHSPYLLIAPFADGQLEPRLAALVTKQGRLGRQGHAVFELDALAPYLH